MTFEFDLLWFRLVGSVFSIPSYTTLQYKLISYPLQNSDTSRNDAEALADFITMSNLIKKG